MRDFIKYASVILFLVFNISLTHAQNVKGIVVDSDNLPIIGAAVSILELEETEYTNASGKYLFFEIPDGNYTLSIKHDGTEILQHSFVLEASVDLGKLRSQKSSDQETNSEKFAVVSLTAGQIESDQDDSSVSSLLSASDDAFVRTSAFGFGSARFRARGLDSEYESMYINGVPMNELENGRIYYGQWGGLMIYLETFIIITD